MASGFSRLQLAAALLEYDNDPDNPAVPKRSAHESAIFANFRRIPKTYPPSTSHKNDHLGVLPSGDGSDRRSDHIMDNRRSKASIASINTLQNPFGLEDQLYDEHEHEEEDLEVDLASWGLDAFVPKDKTSRNGKGKMKSTGLASQPISSVPSHHPFTNYDGARTIPRRALGASRSMSVGGHLEYFGTENGDSLSPLKLDNRRRSIGSPMDATGMETPQIMQRRRASSYTLPTSAALPPSAQPIPFPTSSIYPASPNTNDESGSYIRSSFPDGNSGLNPSHTHERTLSRASMDSKLLLKDGERGRTMSNATMATLLLADDNPFTVQPPSRASRFDPKAAAHARTISNASMGSRILDHEDMSIGAAEVLGERERRYSTTLDLLRPKVLVMPSPLQPVSAPAPPPNNKVRDGFQLSTDGPPLPPGARSARRSSAAFSALEPPSIASNSFTPNPLANLSLSQMTFRNTLSIGDLHIEGNLPRAMEDGEQVNLHDEDHEPQKPTTPNVDEPFTTARPPGKLYGKSLIDDLEDRKTQMRNKQRVFTGDERPSMMARGPQQRASTLIDPAALQTRPTSQRLSSYGSQGPQQTLGRRNSANVKPLLNFDEENKITSNTPGTRLPSGRSVFGVDTLWEREMTKLREMEAQEKVEKSREDVEEAGTKKKKKKQKRRQKLQPNPAVDSDQLDVQTSLEPRVSTEPPILPDIPRALRKPPPHVPEDESESERSEDTKPRLVDADWHAASSSDDEGPRRMTGTGPRYRKNRPRQTHQTGDQSEDDLPLSVAIKHIGRQHADEGDSEDERPLSTLLQKKRSNPPVINPDNFLGPNRRHEEDDDQPLGLRVSRFSSYHARGQGQDQGQVGVDGDDDNKPLAYHPEQQRRTQYQMMAQQQQQHQLMLQAQMQNNTFFPPPSMINTPFFGPPMMPMMMQTPPALPMHDEAKYGRVDRWRRDVAVEGDA